MSEKFETSTTLLKVDENLGLIFGWAIISKQQNKEYFDLQGDHIPEDAMLKAAADFMINSRVSKDMHAGDQIGQVVFAWPMTSEIAKAMNMETDTTGLMIAIKPDNQETLEKYRNGDYTGFSIGGFVKKEEKAND